MPSLVFIPTPDLDLFAQFAARVHEEKPKAIGVASAFVSTYGTTRLVELWESIGKPPCRAIFGIDHEITHPGAITLASEAGIEVRLGASTAGIFHPKLVLGGSAWSEAGELTTPKFLYVGSANLTYRGIRVNTEVGLIATGQEVPEATGELFGELWRKALLATPESVAEYAVRFSKRNAQRKPRDLDELEVSEAVSASGLTAEVVAGSPEPDKSVQDPAHATGAWAGLQTITGEYALQVEFPRSAGEVLRNRLGDGATLSVLCADGERREMLFRYYPDNAMYRLNVHNATPEVAWVREHRQGIAVIEVLDGEVSLRLLRPGREADEVISKSAALGSWGKTPTRLYGWY